MSESPKKYEAVFYVVLFTLGVLIALAVEFAQECWKLLREIGDEIKKVFQKTRTPR